ncbi:MAG: hypothetical protein QM642_04680 [Edaphocola sp.]
MVKSNVNAGMVYPSKFLKADMRSSTVAEHSLALRSQLDGGLSIDDVTISQGGSLRLTAAAPTGVLVIPIVGSVLLNDEVVLDAGNVYWCPRMDAELNLRNIQETGTVNCVIMKMRQDGLSRPVSLPQAGKHTVDILSKNSLIQAEGLPSVHIGVYDSRRKDLVAVQAPDERFLVYVVNGAFEVDGRLMEYRDALLLWDTAEVDFEALAEESILLTIFITNN